MRRERFTEHYSDLVNPRTLGALARNVRKYEPDGLVSIDDIVVSLLSQVRASGGSANFLNGDKAVTLTINFLDGGMEFDWKEKESLIPRIFHDAGYPAMAAHVRDANIALNRAGFFVLDEDHRQIVILRHASGSLSMVIRS